MGHSKRPDWSQRLPEPVKAGRRTLRTLADVSAFLLALPPERQTYNGWRTLTLAAIEAAEGRREIGHVVTLYRLARMLDP